MFIRRLEVVLYSPMLPSSKLLQTGSVIGMALLSLIASGCGNNAFPTQDSSDQTPSIRANLPADFPWYEGAQTKLSFFDENGTGGTLVQETSDSLVQARASVEASMRQNGFQPGEAISSDQTDILTFTKGNVKYQVNIVHNNSKTTIQSIRSTQ